MKLETLWCQVCDQKVVSPEDPTSGSFHVVCGHNVKRDGGIGRYRAVVFAVCSDCNPVDAVKRAFAS